MLPVDYTKGYPTPTRKQRVKLELAYAEYVERMEKAVGDLKAGGGSTMAMLASLDRALWVFSRIDEDMAHRIKRAGLAKLIPSVSEGQMLPVWRNWREEKDAREEWAALTTAEPWPEPGFEADAAE